MTANERKHRTSESLARTSVSLASVRKRDQDSKGQVSRISPKSFRRSFTPGEAGNPRSGTKQEEETLELTESYRVTVERIRASRLPPALVLMHVKHGFTEGRTCGDCASLGEIWLHSEPRGQAYCHVARSFVVWDPAWLACGKWRDKA